MAAPTRCPGCSADHEAPTADGRCRRCRTTLSPELLEHLSSKPVSPRHSQFSPTDRKLAVASAIGFLVASVKFSQAGRPAAPLAK